MTSATSTAQQYSIPNALIPAEVTARFRRSMGFPQPKVTGATVDQEGISNNYAISPKRSAAHPVSKKTRGLQVLAFAAVTWIPVTVAILVS